MSKCYGGVVRSVPALSTAVFLLVVALALGFAGVASAELTDTFELDGNAFTDNASPGLPDDWDRLYDPATYGDGHAALWTGVIDDYGPAETTRFTGSKDIHEIEDWKWDSNPITPKDEIENAYAALYPNGHFIFGSDRYKTSGSAQMGFWLLQGDISLNPDGTFDGTHVDGDALILSHFSSGGRVSDIELYLWDTSRPAGDRLVQVTPLDSTIVYAYVSDFTSVSPWPYDPDGKAPDNEFQVMSFFEGAADLDSLGITGCFTNFLAETRTSFSLTAELKDFVLGEFPSAPSVTVNSEEICEGETAELCATVTGGVPPYTYSWTGPSGFTATTECTGPISVAGTYTVTVTGDNGCPAQPANGALTVNYPPTLVCTGDELTCDYTLATASVTSDPSTGVSYVWTPAPVSGQGTATAMYDTPGFKKVVVAIDATGCRDSCEAEITQDLTKPVLSCQGDELTCDHTIGTATVTSDPSTGVSYVWSPAPLTGQGTATATYDTPGFKKVVVTYLATGCADSCEAEITQDLTKPTLNCLGDHLTCDSTLASATVSSTPSVGVTYAWSPEPVSGQGTAHARYDTPGSKKVVVTYDATGCKDSCDALITQDVEPPPCTITRTGGEADTVCPCFPENPDAVHEYCGPEGPYTYAWSVTHGADIITATDLRCATVRPIAHCDTFFVVVLTVTDTKGCQSTCRDTAYVVDNTPPVVDWCPPDTVIECHDLGDVWPLNPGSQVIDLEGPTGSDNCDPSPWVSHADKGDRPTNWQRSVDEWGSCGEDTTLLRTWYITDFCGNVDSSCVQAIAIQDTIPPRLFCPPDTTVLCESPIVFGDPTATDSCDPDWLVEIIIESTQTVPGPGLGEFTHTRCWTATDSCGNPAPTCCQSIIEQACPDEYCTYTQGGWGSGCPVPQQGDSLSEQPGCVRDYYFSRVFPNGVRIGDQAGPDGGPLYTALWTSALAVEMFLPNGGTAGALTADITDANTAPMGTPAGILAAQILALRMNVGYSCEPTVYDNRGFTEPLGCYADFLIPDSCDVSSGSVFTGMRVDAFLAIADSVVGGDTDIMTAYGITYLDVNFTATCLNEAFDNCDPGRGDGLQAPLPYSLDGELESGLEETPASSPIPTRFAVGQSYPNPFNPSAKISFALPSDGRVLIEVYNIVGRKVITLIDGHKQAGYHSVRWFGKDIQGRPVASGVYFCRVQFGEDADVQKMILLK
jgi:hypothetical protein